MLITEEYKRMMRQMHKGTRWGSDGRKWARALIAIAHEANAAEVLDYGCGKGELKKALAELDPHLIVGEYDPGIPGKALAPIIPYDVVACTDVLEHVEPACIRAVLAHIRSLTAKRVLFVVSLRPARARLPNGDNAHILLKDAAWWEDEFAGAGFAHLESHHRPGKELMFIGQ